MDVPTDTLGRSRNAIPATVHTYLSQLFASGRSFTADELLGISRWPEARDFKTKILEQIADIEEAEGEDSNRQSLTLIRKILN